MVPQSPHAGFFHFLSKTFLINCFQFLCRCSQFFDTSQAKCSKCPLSTDVTNKPLAHPPKMLWYPKVLTLDFFHFFSKTFLINCFQFLCRCPKVFDTSRDKCSKCPLSIAATTTPLAHPPKKLWYPKVLTLGFFIFCPKHF